MKRYNPEVLGISETHWTQVQQQRLTSRELLLYSSHKEKNAPHTQGVALMLFKQAQTALTGWESHGPRIIKASFKKKKEGITMNIIQCYAPTNDYNEDAKDQFYDRLQSIIEKCPTKDMTILMGDFNAKVGTDNTGHEDIMGRHGLGERDENAMTAEKAAREGNMRQLYDITKKLSGNRRKPERPVKRKEGEVITNIEEQRNRWVEHFEKLLNRPAPLNPPNIEAAPTDLSIDVGPPTI
ncbi:unnamed protein product [Schistosoma curassoni]|uniref:Endo/exonuclease/phosphatase domain-containing protein n=1 Tax=Schistosoma curassoni TaxID=6186 RepID=A0A183KK62_9TREM|nr:unnamed protein product [Schistosoma curassoni]